MPSIFFSRTRSAMAMTSLALLTWNGSSAGRVSAAYGRLFELSCDLEGSGFAGDQPFRLQLSIWKDGLPLDALPAQGWIEFVPAQPSD